MPKTAPSPTRFTRSASRLPPRSPTAEQVLRGGGRLFYAGRGTSGRLGVLDASEIPPTFGAPPDLVQGIIAGGQRRAHALAGRRRGSPGGRARRSGFRRCSWRRFRHWHRRERYHALRARRIDARPLARRAHRDHRLLAAADDTLAAADIAIVVLTGPEVVTGSTRMKAGTATKLVLNTITTGAMIRLGKTYGNLMVDLQASNAKLSDRARTHRVRSLRRHGGRSPRASLCGGAAVRNLRSSCRN